MKQRRLVVVVAIAAALVGGLVLLPHALEPGRAESNGIVLSVSGDWFAASPNAALKTRSRQLVVETGPKFGYQAVTRPLAVFPRTRYRARLSITQNRTRGYVRVMDARLDRELASAPLPLRNGEVELVFDTGPESRVALLLVAGAHSRLNVSEASILRLG
jgi:hypothetical protein